MLLLLLLLPPMSAISVHEGDAAGDAAVVGADADGVIVKVLKR